MATTHTNTSRIVQRLFLLLSVVLATGVLLAGTTHYTYDDLGRVIRVEHPSGTVVEYEYDDAGNITRTWSTGCEDVDGDGVCAADDCDDTRPHCTTDCTDVDVDDYCVTDDCDDAVATCAEDCATDADGDGLRDCEDTCLDADGDGYGAAGSAGDSCFGPDCDDNLWGCSTDCTDVDLDLFCAPMDCDDGGAPQPSDGVHLQVSKGASPGDVTLDWTGGQPVFDVFRSSVPDVSGDLLGSTSGQSWPDTPPAGDAYYDQIGSPCEIDCPERCDGADNDCDGSIDEPEMEGICRLGGASAICLNGSCQVDQCDPDTWDANGDPSDGCEYACVYQSDADEPDPDFIDANCDGIDGRISRAIFVSTGGDDANPGSTPDAPVQTIAQALTLAVGVRDQILVDEGIYAESLTLQEGIGIYGGYRSATGWSRSIDAETRVEGDTTAVTAANLSSPTVLELLTIVADDAVVTVPSSYGVLAQDADGLIIRRCHVIAGSGWDGADGATNPALAADGGAGGEGDAGCEDGGFPCIPTCSQPDGGAGGTSTCDGAGGTGGDGRRGGDGTADGDDGLPGTGLLGGAAGQGTPYNGGNWDTPPDYWGGNGGGGSPGVDGAAGSTGFTSSGYLPIDGTAGVAGGDGSGGGGGGGGGGGNDVCDSFGGGGGGGGGGGCGGGGGGGGVSGGISVAIYLWNSDADILDSLLTTSGGGDGGDGGTGQPGGFGAEGGNHPESDGSYAGRGNPHGGSNEQEDASNGGRGGWGGDGGRGGHGGGGTGGPSIGIMKGGDSAPTLTGNTFQIAPGGSGGDSAGQPGPDGPTTEEHP